MFSLVGIIKSEMSLGDFEFAFEAMVDGVGSQEIFNQTVPPSDGEACSFIGLDDRYHGKEASQPFDEDVGDTSSKGISTFNLGANSSHDHIPLDDSSLESSFYGQQLDDLRNSTRAPTDDSFDVLNSFSVFQPTFSPAAASTPFVDQESISDFEFDDYIPVHDTTLQRPSASNNFVPTLTSLPVVPAITTAPATALAVLSTPIPPRRAPASAANQAASLARGAPPARIRRRPQPLKNLSEAEKLQQIAKLQKHCPRSGPQRAHESIEAYLKRLRSNQSCKQRKRDVRKTKLENLLSADQWSDDDGEKNAMLGVDGSSAGSGSVGSGQQSLPPILTRGIQAADTFIANAGFPGAFHQSFSNNPRQAVQTPSLQLSAAHHTQHIDLEGYNGQGSRQISSPFGTLIRPQQAHDYISYQDSSTQNNFGISEDVFGSSDDDRLFVAASQGQALSSGLQRGHSDTHSQSRAHYGYNGIQSQYPERGLANTRDNFQKQYQQPVQYYNGQAPVHIPQSTHFNAGSPATTQKFQPDTQIHRQHLPTGFAPATPYPVPAFTSSQYTTPIQRSTQQYTQQSFSHPIAQFATGHSPDEAQQWKEYRDFEARILTALAAEQITNEQSAHTGNPIRSTENNRNTQTPPRSTSRAADAYNTHASQAQLHREAKAARRHRTRQTQMEPMPTSILQQTVLHPNPRNVRNFISQRVLQTQQHRRQVSARDQLNEADAILDGSRCVGSTLDIGASPVCTTAFDRDDASSPEKVDTSGFREW